ncbi:sigma-70 family RNA polymerase sigma factor [Angustibacter peucedani]
MTTAADDAAAGVTPGGASAIPPAEPADDLRALAARAVEGDPQATEQLLADVRRLVHRYARGRLGRYRGAEDAADDAAQEVCIAVLTALPRYSDRGVPFEAFVHGIASRKVADVQRAAIRRPQPTDVVQDGVDPAPGPEDLALRAADADHARDLLATLPETQREVLTLRVAAGWTAEETGRALGMSPGAVRVTQHRALAKLRELAARSQEGAS